MALYQGKSERTLSLEIEVPPMTIQIVSAYLKNEESLCHNSDSYRFKVKGQLANMVGCPLNSLEKLEESIA